MSDREFDAYLALLTRFLRLSGRQRDEIRRELRAHLEEALDDYLARGLTHHDAVLRALEDFGDAAELAARFRAIGRTRRWIMRGAATAAGIGIMAVTTSFFMSSPATPVQAGFKPAAMMQSGTGGAAGTGASNSTPRVDGEATAVNAPVLATLRKPIPEIALEETPFSAFVEYITELTGVNVVVEWGALEENGVDRDRGVSLKLKNVSAERVLAIVLANLGHGAADVSHQVKDGILFISTTEALKRELVTRVYDVRDLLTAGLDWEKTKERLLGRRPAATGDATADGAGSRGSAPAGAPAGGGGTPVKDAAASEASEDGLNWPERSLTGVISETVEPNGWTSNGGAGTATIYNGILIVRQHELAHDEIEKLLLMLRDAGAGGERGDGSAAAAGSSSGFAARDESRPTMP